MSTTRDSVEAKVGPSGFIEINQNMLVVDYGKIYLQDGTTVGFLFEDGLIQATAAAPQLGSWDGIKAIEEFPGCTFRGIDSSGAQLELPGGRRGPTGGLRYNEVPYNVIHGRISRQDHKLVGYMEDDFSIHLKDHKNAGLLHKMDELSQLTTIFQGLKSNGQVVNHEFVRELHRKDRSYSDNEIIRYFKDFDNLNTVQKKYVLETMRLWAVSGLLQIVRKSEGDAMLGNVKHGAAGVTGVRTGHVTLDKEEFEKEITLYKRFGPLAIIGLKMLRPYNEVRINLVVSHEFGHQLEFTLSQASQDRVTDVYQKRLSTSNRLHPLPGEYEGASELLLQEQIENRVFISGYSRFSMHEYWAEATAAFSVRESRESLRALDPTVYDILKEVIYFPEKVLSPRFEKESLRLQSSLRVGGELTDDLLEK